MISLATSQSPLAARADVVPARLFHLTTYLDRDRGTIDREFWWSIGAPWLYKWGGGVYREFDDLVRAASPVEYGMTHLPLPGRVDTRRTSMRVELSAEDVDGAPLWKTLSTDALTFARLEVASLLIEPERLAPNTPWWDLRDLPGTEHVVRFRGEFTGVDEVSDDAVVLLFDGEEPNVDWPEALDDTQVDPKDLGKRYAIPFGNAKAVPCINRNVGWTTTLAAQLSASFTGNVAVTSAVGLPATGSFTLQVGTERVTATKVDASTVNISARGVNSTIATTHQAGESVLEVQTSITVVVAGVPCKALDALYVINPATREKVKVGTAFTTNLDDRLTDPGRRLTTVTFTQAQFQSLIDTLGPSAGDPYEELLINSFSIEVPGGTGYVDAQLNVDGLGIRLQGGSSGQTLEKALWKLDSGAIPTALLGRPISRVRFKARMNGEGDTTTDNLGNAKTNMDGQATLLGWGVSGVNVVEHMDRTWQAGVQESGVVIASNWITPVPAKTVGDLATDLDGIRFYLLAPSSPAVGYGTDNWAFIFADSVMAELELAPSPQSTLGAASYGWGLQFVADVQGVMVPYSYLPGYGFDEGTGWSLTSTSAQTDQGGSQKIAATAGLLGDSGAACDDSTLWVGTTATLATETTIKTQGSASLKVTPTAGGSQAQADRTFTSALDLSNVLIPFDVRADGGSHLGAADGIRFRLGDGTNNKRWDYGTDDGLVTGAFSTLILDPQSTPDNSTGSLNLASVPQMRCVANGRTTATSSVGYFDNIRFVTRVAVAQRNTTAGTIDLTASGLRYAVRLKATNVRRIASVIVRFSNTAGTGTTLPAAYRSVTIPGSELAEGVWLTVEKIATDTGSPSVNNVEMVRIEIVHNATGPEAPTVDIDSIGGAEATNGAWDGATPATLLTAGPDAIRWFVGELAGVGAVNVLGVSTAKTNLGSDAFAGNLCALGTDFGGVLARLCFETRTNVVRKEGASVAQYQLWNASSAYAFPASSLTLEELRELRERMRAANEVATHFRFHFGVELADAQLAQNESAFRSILLTDPSTNDLTTPATATLAAAAAVLGRRDSGPIYLLFTQDEPTAKDVAGYYASELVAYARRRWTCLAPVWEAYALEPGDVVAFTPRWASAAVKARVTGVTVDLADPSIGLSLEEVN